MFWGEKCFRGKKRLGEKVLGKTFWRKVRFGEKALRRNKVLGKSSLEKSVFMKKCLEKVFQNNSVKIIYFLQRKVISSERGFYFQE